MKKHPIFVSVPTDYTCISLADYRTLVDMIRCANNKNDQLITDRNALAAKVDELTKKLAEAGQKIVDLEKEVEAKDESLMFWYRKSCSLESEKKEADDGNAKAS